MHQAVFLEGDFFSAVPLSMWYLRTLAPVIGSSEPNHGATKAAPLRGGFKLHFHKKVFINAISITFVTSKK